MTWWIATVAPHLEKRAEAELDAAGVATFLPLECKPIQNARVRSLVERGKLAQPYRTYAAYPGYLLVQVDRSIPEFWHRVRDCRHVRGIITNDGQPAELKDDVVSALGGDMVCGLRLKSEPWAIGDRVAVTEGAFASFNGTVSRGLRRDSVQILLRMMGALQRVEIPALHLAKVA